MFSGVLTDLGETIDYCPPGEDPIPTIFDYVEGMRCQLWEVAFFIELGGDNGAHKNNPPRQATVLYSGYSSGPLQVFSIHSPTHEGHL